MAVVLAVVFATFVLLPGVARATTLYVGGSGPGNYTTIGSAVAAASPGDTISVFSGSYPEKVYIGKTLSLVGQDPATTILDDGSFFISGAPWVNISGFTLNGRGIGDGIKLWFADHAIIANNRIANYEVGAWVNSTENVTFTADTFTRCGIYIDGPYGQRLTDWNTHVIDASNTVNGKPVVYWADAVRGTVPPGAGEILLANVTGVVVQGEDLQLGSEGIEVGFSANVSVVNNVVSSNNLDGIALYHSDNITVANNTMQYNARGVVIWSSSNISVGDNTITSTHGAGVYTVASQFVTLANNSLTSGGLGVDVASSLGNILVMNNTVSRNTLGIVGGDLILGNTVTNNTVGIRGGTRVSRNTVSWNADTGIENSETVEANVVEGNGQGIRYDSTYGGRIAGNTVIDNGLGIHLHLAQGAVVDQNNVSSNQQSGIQLEFSSGPTIVGNNVTNNAYGPNATAGIYLLSTTSSLIYHNNIVGNSVQAHDDGGNRWDNGYPSGGNHWSDYAGVDDCSGISQNVCPDPDGIGDTPYAFSTGRDNYPRLATWTPNPTPPSDPLNVQGTPGDGTITLSWEGPALDGGAVVKNYTVYRGTRPGAEIFLVRLGNQRTYVDTSVTNGQAYYFRVSATNAAGEGSLSTEASATPRSVPTAPTSLSAVGSGGAIILRWLPPESDGGSHVTFYTVYRGTASGSETYLIGVGNVTSATDSSVARGTRYYYAVAAGNAAGEGVRSTQASASLGNLLPMCSMSTPAPDAVVAGVYPLTGSASDPDGVVVRVEFQVDGEAWTSANGTSMWRADWDTRSLPNGPHAVRARSYDGSNYSPEVVVNVTVDNPVIPSSPSGEGGSITFGLAALAAVAVVEGVLLAISYQRKRAK